MIGSVDRIPQIEAMRWGVDYHFEVKIRDFVITLRPLSIKETIDVTNRVIQQVNENPAASQNPIYQQTLMANETLVLASTSDYGANDPKITQYILERLTPDELNAIFKQYVAGCDRANPSLERLSADEVEALVDEIKKNPDWKENPLLPLIGLSIGRLANITLHLLTKND